MITVPQLIAKHGLTPKQARAVVAIPTAPTVGHAMKQAGYTDATLHNIDKNLLRKPKVQNALADIVSGLDSVASKLTLALDQVDYSKREPEKNAYVLDKIVKNRQLLSGNSTENTAIIVSWD